VQPHLTEVGIAVPQLSQLEASQRHATILPCREPLAIQTDQV
jgi:hypothetical protein